MKENKHKTIHRSDYQPPPYLIDSVNLTFLLSKQNTEVLSVAAYRRNETNGGAAKNLELHGDNLTLLSISIDDRQLTPEEYSLTEDGLCIFSPPEQFSLEMRTLINPEQNTALSGLYCSSGNYCTQCEAEGFRRIIYYLDRPDILTEFTVRIEADKEECPVLLANGNLVDEGELKEGKHFAVWHDPFPKPSYLFALVAGRLVSIDDNFTTASGREVQLSIYVEEKNRHKCDHAMVSLKKAMRWDEEVFGLEYDLDIYMIVAVDDFNMGAMENKGLNIFNSKYVLASPETATDQDYLGVEGVIGHEYFHNWTGNRVTCRDWFQLSLKEGLTVFRDQEFSSDMNSRSVKRVSDVKILRNFQFREDAGPMAHPVRPDSYVEINNFYTLTIYNKGAEVIRMMYHLIGAENFRKGMDLYFQRFDGMAVTCDDFAEAMEDASGMDLSQFKLWYSQAGTPKITIEEEWLDKEKIYNLVVSQNCPPSPGQESKLPFHMPFELGLLEPEVRDGKYSGSKRVSVHSLELTETVHSFSFDQFETKPVLSPFRGFSAPVKVAMTRPREELAYLMTFDSDAFNRWDSAFTLSSEIILETISQLSEGKQPALDQLYLEAFHSCLVSDGDFALIAQAITLPTDSYIAQMVDKVEPALIHQARQFIKKVLHDALRDDFIEVYEKCEDYGSYSLTNEAVGRRSLKNLCLSYLVAPGGGDQDSISRCYEQYQRHRNMTDVIAALSCLSHLEDQRNVTAFDDFYGRWQNDSLIIDKWFTLQACSTRDTTLSEVKNLMRHPAFSIDNPNKVRSLVGAFCNMNHARFHEQNGAGYRFLANQILKVDRRNPQIAARLVTPLTTYRQYTQKLKVQMEEQLQFILLQKNISRDVYEIVKKSVDA